MNTMLQNHGLVGVIPPYDLLQKGQNMLGKTICVVAGDTGGLNALLPVLNIALENGCKINAFLAATCRTEYKASQLKLDERIHVATGIGTPEVLEIFFRDKDCDLLLVGASQSKEGAEAASNAALHCVAVGIRVIGVEDMYASMGPTLVQSNGAFSQLCVIDEYAKHVTLERHPNMIDSIAVTGGPQFDKVVEVKKNWTQRRTEIRKALKAKDDTLVFLLAGGVNGSAELLEIIDEGIRLAGVGNYAKVIWCIHPRSTDEDGRLFCHHLVHKTHVWHYGNGKEAAANIDDLLPGVDFVVSGFSTVNHLGILYEMPGVIYVGTPAFKKDLMAEKGLKRPPEVDAGAAWYVQTPEEMARVITGFEFRHNTTDFLKLFEIQHRIASYNDGHAAERVWQEMCKLMGT